MKPTHIFKHPDFKSILEWHKPSGRYRSKRKDDLGDWTLTGYPQEAIESCGWKCHPIPLENK